MLGACDFSLNLLGGSRDDVMVCDCHLKSMLSFDIFMERFFFCDFPCNVWIPFEVPYLDEATFIYAQVVSLQEYKHTCHMMAGGTTRTSIRVSVFRYSGRKL